MLPSEVTPPLTMRLHIFSGVWLAVTLFLVFEVVALALSPFELALQICLIAVGGVMTLSASFARGFWSPACLFILVVVLFHAGLAPFLLFGIDPEFTRPDDYQWFYGHVGSRSLSLVAMFISVFVLTATLSALMPRTSRLQSSVVLEEQQKSQRLVFAHFGAASLVAGIVYWVVIAYSVGGTSIFFGSYVGFLLATSGTSLSISYMMIGLGLGLAVLGREWCLVRLSLYVFFVFGFFAFFLGLRGEVLFPLAVAASVLALRMRMPRGFIVVSALILVLSLINGAKNIRSSGLAGGPVDPSAFTPLGALAELGSSLRVVAHTVIWHEQQGSPFRGGDTYSVSLARLFESLFSPFGSPQASSDFRIMNSEIMERSGAIGGSVVAEAFHNFGVAGVFVAAALAGLVFGLFSLQQFSVNSAVLYVCVAVPLFNHIRNSFVPVLPFILVSGCVLMIVYAISRRRSVTSGAAT
jgi:hypothetical protein